MSSLEHLHQIEAADPRAQAKFFLLLTEPHDRFLIGLERLHIGRMVLAQQGVTTQDEVAACLQRCVAPVTTDVQAPFEAQGWGFVHGHGKGHSIIGQPMSPRGSWAWRTSAQSRSRQDSNARAAWTAARRRTGVCAILLH